VLFHHTTPPSYGLQPPIQAVGIVLLRVSYVVKNAAAGHASISEPYAGVGYYRPNDFTTNSQRENDKTNLPPGALPTMTPPTPRYTPLNPPALTNPCADWRRVLSVSIGKNNKSTDVPAAPPAYPFPSQLHVC